MGISKLVRSLLVVTLFIPAWAFAQSYPGGQGVGTVSACPSIPELEGMTLNVVLGPGEGGPSSTTIKYATFDGIVFGPPCDILFVPPSTLYIECGPHQAQLTVAITPLSASIFSVARAGVISQPRIGF